MSTFDYILIGILVLSGLAGILRGLIRESLSVASWLIALWAAGRYGGEAGRLFRTLLADPLWQLWAGRLALFIGVLFAGALLAWLIGYLVRRSAITGTDRALGALFGLVRGVVLAGLLALALDLGGFATEPWWQESKLIPYAAAVGTRLRALAADQLASQEGVRL